MNAPKNTSALPDRMLTVDDVQEILNVSRQVVLRLIAEGELPAHKIGSSWRIQASDFARYLETTRTSSGTGWSFNHTTEGVA